MERVQFQQEQMLAELKDFEDKGIFTLKETRSILARRTQFETALVRRVPKKADFLRYIRYEMGLEELRWKRVSRLNLPRGPPTISDYALPRRQFHLFERALSKFKSDVGLWTAYVECAKREGAWALVGRVCARALSLHPSTPQLYILAASHELTTGSSPSAARVLLQRGIRLNPTSREIWREWVRMECVFIESVRRRWQVLGIEEEEKNEVMNGAIVRQVLSAAIKAICDVEMYQELDSVLRDFGQVTPESRQVWESLMKHLNPLNDMQGGEDVVNGVGRANEDKVRMVRGGSLSAEEYQEWIAACTVQSRVLLDSDSSVYLAEYLQGSLQFVLS